MPLGQQVGMLVRVLAECHEFVDLHRPQLALDADAGQVAAYELVLNFLVGKLTDDARCVVLLVLSLQARGKVHRVTHDGPLKALAKTHVPDVYNAGVDADADVDRRRWGGRPGRGRRGRARARGGGGGAGAY